MTSDTDAASLSTTFAYAAGSGGGRQVTSTRVGLFTEITDYFRDGRVKSRTGTAIVAEYADYDVNTNSTEWSKSTVGSSGGPRYTKTTTDMLGRIVSTEQPNTSAGTVVTTSVYATSGDNFSRLVKTTRSGLADTLYEYDVIGNQVRTGLDVNTNGTLDNSSTDRITESETQFSIIGGEWWSVTTNKVYRTNNSSSTVTTGVNRKKLTGLGSYGRYAESVDIFGNVTTSKTQIDRSNKLVTDTVDDSDSSTDAVAITRNGLAQSSVTKTGLAYTFGYDSLGRRTSVTDPRTGTVTTHYDSSDRVDYVTDAAGNQTSTGYYSNTGRVDWTSDPAGKKTYYSYYDRGQTYRVWGDVPQPVEMGYDSTYGERTTLKTYRGGSGWTGSTWPSGPGTADTTTWTFNAATGLVTAKTYADSKGPTYSYTAYNQLYVRTWARLKAGGGALTTTFSYDSKTGELTGIDYNDSTADVTRTYNRFGALATAAESGVTTHTFSYSNTTLALTSEAITGLYSKTIDRTYDTATGTAGRPTKVAIGSEYEAGYNFDAAGRLNRITGPGLAGSGSTGVSPTAGSGAAYSFASNSDLVSQIDFKSDANTNVAGTTRAFESTRDLIDYVENKWGSTTVSKYDYASDSRVRRTSVVNTGTAFSTSRFTLWAYDDRSELTSSRRYNGTNIADTSSPVSTEQFTYSFDTIGNRTGDTGDPGVTTYSANNLNQYTATSAPTGSFSYDNDGNMTADTRSSTGSMAMTWDAENRLIQVDAVNSPTTWANWRYKYLYDYMGRRVRVQKYDTEEGETLLSDEKFVYDAWNLIEVLDGMNSDAVLKKFTWGLDLSGQNGNAMGSVGVPPAGLHAAGGIGGLLSMVDTKGTTSTADDKQYIYFFNANGDVGQVMDVADGSTDARYEYYPYGGVLVATGTASLANPFRFSTKYWDDDTQMYYYGYRYHKPRIGRWLSRDPAPSDFDFINPFRFLLNTPCVYADAHGLYPVGGPACERPDGTGVCIHPAPVLPRVACCQYTGLRLGAGEERRQVDVYCDKSTPTPQQCCNCTLPRGQGNLRSATWGFCCWCTVSVLEETVGILGGPHSPAHTKITVECPGSSVDSDALGPPAGIGISPIGVGRVGPTSNAGYRVVNSILVDCKCAGSLMAELRKETGTPYCIGVDDCRRFAWDRFYMFAHDCATLP